MDFPRLLSLEHREQNSRSQWRRSSEEARPLACRLCRRLSDVVGHFGRQLSPKRLRFTNTSYLPEPSSDSRPLASIQPAPSCNVRPCASFLCSWSKSVTGMLESVYGQAGYPQPKYEASRHHRAHAAGDDACSPATSGGRIVVFWQRR
ncbi:hypothetical protein HPB50_020395 [Hyalomma asiaticum]|uniref:Uncharacterized protein n=1 Tax=Hyalomma asiaticum TaxID=266040 RepID=A0ACB7RL98_HYAAI|nr:hypothetical protein HPB50_020395 [Hyalomma asiaticum]